MDIGDDPYFGDLLHLGSNQQLLGEQLSTTSGQLQPSDQLGEAGVEGFKSIRLKGRKLISARTSACCVSGCSQHHDISAIDESVLDVSLRDDTFPSQSNKAEAQASLPGHVGFGWRNRLDFVVRSTPLGPIAGDRSDEI